MPLHLKYSIGDTVLLATNVRTPSIGVIVALWEVSTPVARSQMFANMHWLLRPAELAQTRTKREHLEVWLLIPTFYINGFTNHIPHQNEIYLSLDATSVVDMSSILAHCDIASNSTKCQKPASLRYKSHVSTMANSFFCVNAVDSRRGLYYELYWHAHRKRSLQRARGMMCNGVQVLRGRSWLSPSENVGQRHQHGSRKKLTQSLVLVAMESTGTNQ